MTKDEWIEKLSFLIEDESARMKMGKEGRKKDYGTIYCPDLCPKAYRMDQGSSVKRIVFFTHQNPQGYRIQQYFPFFEDGGIM